jgi:hypothetical protein
MIMGVVVLSLVGSKISNPYFFSDWNVNQKKKKKKEFKML